VPLAGGVPTSAWFAPPSPEAVRRVVDRVYRDDEIQRSLPTPEDPLALPDWLASVAGVLVWVGAGVAALLLLAWVVRASTSRGRRAALDAPAGVPAPDASVLEGPLAAAEALAARGLHAEAIHALLLRTLSTLVAVTNTVLPPALTSREILRRVPLEDRPRAALSALVLAVEVSRFGGASAGPDDYALCLERFRQFSAAYGRTG
jgi:hypothetical protein